MTGVGGDWRANSGMRIGSYYVGFEGRELYRFVGLRGNTFIDKLGLIRFEIIHGSLETNDTSGEGSFIGINPWETGIWVWIITSRNRDIRMLAQRGFSIRPAEGREVMGPIFPPLSMKFIVFTLTVQSPGIISTIAKPIPKSAEIWPPDTFTVPVPIGV